MVWSGQEQQFRINGFGPEAEMWAYGNYVRRRSEPNNIVIPGEFKRQMAENWYLRRGRLSRGVLWINITDVSGGGKHTVSQFIEERLCKKYGIEKILKQEDIDSLPAEVCKQELRRNGKIQGPLTPYNMSHSVLCQMDLCRRLDMPEPAVELAISWQGPTAIFEDMLLVWGEEKLMELVESHRFKDMLWKEENLDNIVLYEEVMNDGWRTMSEMIDESRKTGEMPWIHWPMVDEPWPMVAILDMSVEKCWELQERQGIRKGERPYAKRPFTKEQMMLMRLMKAVLYYQFNEVGTGPVYKVGGYRQDFEVEGVEAIARELVGEGQRRYRQALGISAS